MAERFPKRGFVWLAVGVGLLVANFFLQNPLVLRGTQIPFWPFVMGVAAVILLIDLRRWRRGGGSPTPPP